MKYYILYDIYMIYHIDINIRIPHYSCISPVESTVKGRVICECEDIFGFDAAESRDLNTVHPPICQFFISRKSVDKSGES